MVSDDKKTQLGSLELRVERHELQIASIKEQQARYETNLEKVQSSCDSKINSISERVDNKEDRIDKLSMRLIIIIAFVSGVIVVSSESGGNLLRSIIGAVI